MRSILLHLRTQKHGRQQSIRHLKDPKKGKKKDWVACVTNPITRLASSEPLAEQRSNGWKQIVE